VIDHEGSDWLEGATRLVDTASSRPWWIAAGVVLLFALLELARWWTQRWIVSWRMRRQAARAIAAEAWAARLLARAGYELVGSQVKGAYDLSVDGRRVTIELRADYVVRRKGRSFVAEVKSGALAPSLETAATRRQLLEYRIAFAVDGVLLVDGETGEIHEVVFPAKIQTISTISRQASLAPF
jgi:hypothetical protein